VAGGVGITVLLPALHAHEERVKLFWGFRSEAFVAALEESLNFLEREVIVGARLNIEEYLGRVIGELVGGYGFGSPGNGGFG
jgi:hypothetical protein